MAIKKPYLITLNHKQNKQKTQQIHKNLKFALIIEFEVLRPNLSGQKICRNVIQFTLDYKCKF